MGKTLRMYTLLEAGKYDGVREEGENWGPWVSKFLAAANVHSPAPWCASYVNFCAQDGAKAKGVLSPLEKVPNQAYVQSYVDYGKKHGWVIPFSKVEAGDLFCIYHPTEGRFAHIGFVTKKNADNTYKTIEGNTNDDGSREGYEVARRVRPNNANVIFLRWDEGV